MRTLSRLKRFKADVRGTAAIEYGLVLPVMLVAILGGLWVGMLTFSASSLDLAVQTAARCMAVDANACGTVSATQAYAQTQYKGPAIAPTFTASTAGCGHTVTAEANFNLNILPWIGTVPLSTSACYP
jgi:Flp pilus assembly protein TadG